MPNKKLICHVEFLIGEKLSEEDLQYLIEKGFDHAISSMIDGLDLTPDSDYCIAEGVCNHNWHSVDPPNEILVYCTECGKIKRQTD